VGDRIHIDMHLFDPNGIHETIILLPSEALDFLGWMLHKPNREKIIHLAAQHRREENVS
jgi:hypothetical protein